MTDYQSFFTNPEEVNLFLKNLKCATEASTIENFFSQNECSHEDYIEDGNKIRICINCGVEIEILHFEPEWRNYGGADSSRCLINNAPINALERILQDSEIHISQLYIVEASQKFDKIIERRYTDKTIRGGQRKGIGGACIMYTMRKYNKAVTPKDICDMLKIKATTLSKGQSIFLEEFPEFKTEYITPQQLIQKTLEKIGFSQDEIITVLPKILALNDYIDKKSQLIVRSSPDSVAGAVVFVYLTQALPKKLEEYNITKKTFAQKVEISEMTIKRLAEDILEIAKGVKK